MDVKLPNGQIIRNVPEGISKEEVLRRYVLKNETTTENEPVETKTKESVASPSFVERLPKELFSRPRPTAQLAIGAAKPIAGALQFAGVNAPAKFLGDMSTRFEKESGSPTLSQGLDIAGEIINPIPIKGASLVEKGVSRVAPKVMNSNLVRGGIQGGISSLFSPVETDGAFAHPGSPEYTNFLEKKLTNAGVSTAAGAGLGKLSQVLMNPKISDEVKKARSMGIDLTPGQLFGFPSLEKKLTSLPISGRLVQSSLEDTNQQMNIAVANEALKNIGKTLPKDVKAGSQMMQELENQVSSSYREIAKKIDFTPDKNTIPFLNAVANRAGKDITRQAEREQFYETIKDAFFTPFFQSYKLSGPAFRDAESRLGTIANDYKNSQNPFERKVGFALN